MTRDEAIAKMKAVPRFEWGEDLLFNHSIDTFVALGMLKLDEPEGSEDTRDKAIGAFWSIRGPVTSRALFEALDKAGLKIVEK